MALIWSSYQNNIFEKTVKTNHNLVIEALAGSSKTTVLIEIGKRLPVSKRTLFCAFNSNIAKELERKLPPTIKSSTIHSLGYSTLMSAYKTNIQLSEFKTLGFIDTHIDKWKINPKEKDYYKFNLLKIIDLIRLNLLEEDDIESIQTLLYNHEIDLKHPEFLSHIKEVMKSLKNYALTYKPTVAKKLFIDFIDMLWIPYVKKLSPKKYDIVLIDEGQDLNKAQQYLINSTFEKNTRFFLVGDKKQTIYQFMGSSNIIFDEYKNHPNTIILPLNVCYRCSKEVIKEAQSVVPEIEFFENNIDGKVFKNSKPDQITENSFVLCRNNKPLFVLYYYLLDKGVKSSLKNKKYEEALIKIITPYKNDLIESMFEALKDRLLSVKENLKERGVKVPTQHPKYLKLIEELNILKVISNRCESIQEMLVEIKNIFNTKTTISLLTCHGSKGLEEKNVFLIRPDLLWNNSKSTQDWMKEMDNNLLYISITRAKENFHYIDKLAFDDQQISKEFEF